MLEYDLYHQGKSFDFSQESKAQLRAKLDEDFPLLNFRQGLESGLDRVAATRYIANDKLADVRPNDFYVLLTTQASSIELLDSQLQLVDEVSLRLPVNRLNILALSTLGIVENQDVFEQWHKVILPAELRNAIAVYRGNDKGLTSGIKNLLEVLPVSCECLMFSDLDPKGLEMCYTTEGVTGLLAPCITDIKTHLMKQSQPALYIKQHASVEFLKRRKIQKWQPLQSFVLDNHLAIVQQSMVQQSIALKKYQ